VKKENPDSRAGHLLRHARLRAGLNQVEVAARAGLPQSTISAYESGRRQPTLPMLSKLLEATGSDLTIATAPLPEQLSALTGPVGLRVRRHRQLIVEEATRQGLDNVRVIGAVARGQDRPGDQVELLGQANPAGTVVDLLKLSALLEELIGTPVKIFTADRLPSGRRGTAERDGVAL
jgi:uncharacterized protein